MSRIPNRNTPVLQNDGAFEALWFRFLESLSRKEAPVISTVTSGTREINASAGRFRVLGGDTFAFIVNNKVTADSIVMAQFATADATGRVTAVSVVNGAFTVDFTATTGTSDIFFAVLS